MVSILVTDKNQRIGDLAAGTIVVREPRGQGDERWGPRRARGPASGRAARPSPASRSRRRRRPARARRTRPPGGVLDVSAVSADDLAAVRAFLDRRPDLPPGVRGDLARRIASALAPRVGGAAAQLHDEDLIEAVAAAKARER